MLKSIIYVEKLPENDLRFKYKSNLYPLLNLKQVTERCLYFEILTNLIVSVNININIIIVYFVTILAK